MRQISKMKSASNCAIREGLGPRTRGHVRLENWWIRRELRHIKTRAAVMVYMLLRSYRDRKTGTCYPSQTHIMKCTGLSVCSIGRAIKELCDLEPITVVESRHDRTKRWRNNTYCVYDEAVRSDEPARSERARRKSTEPVSQS